MINDENRTDLIDQYLSGELSGEMLQEFEEQLEGDSDFRKEVALQQKIIQTIKEKERSDLRNDIKQLFKEEVEDKKAPLGGKADGQQEEVKEIDDRKVVDISPHRRYIAIAAAIGLLILTAILFFTLQPDNSDPQFVFLEVTVPPGGRGVLPTQIPDSLAVEVISQHSEYNFHYQLKDTLKLYGDFNINDLTIYYEPNAEQYLLLIDDTEYSLNTTSDIVPLRP
ncbi:hypothetical protein WJR50_17675 [Catalinimonas sp. 4WD22]|uniref:anti-sigma factor family protein n=1 Tax=Catalinimonas locisalis TaxID=3133978 RepID=UPI003101AFAE